MSISDIGRSNAVKTSLEDSIEAACVGVVDQVIVIDAWRMKTWNFNSRTGTLVTMRLMPSKDTPLNYGSRIVNGHNGTYYTYNITLRIIDTNIGEDLESETEYQVADAIVKYFRTNQEDTVNGILSIYDINVRDTAINAGMSGVIITMKILAERPLFT